MAGVGFGLEITGDALERYEYASAHVDGWITSALGDKAHQYIPWAQAEFDRFFDSRTGNTRRDIVAWKHKGRKASDANIEWWVRPVRDGRNSSGYNYLYRWIPGAAGYSGIDRDFMGKSFAMWRAGNDLASYVAIVVGERFNGLR